MGRIDTCANQGRVRVRVVAVPLRRLWTLWTEAANALVLSTRVYLNYIHTCVRCVGRIIGRTETAPQQHRAHQQSASGMYVTTAIQSCDVPVITDFGGKSLPLGITVI